jgi:site-specific recombinase XerD
VPTFWRSTTSQKLNNEDENLNLNDAVTTFVTGYFSTCRRSQKTEAAYKIDLAQFEVYVGADADLEGIDPARIEGWANHMRTEGYACVFR